MNRAVLLFLFTSLISISSNAKSDTLVPYRIGDKWGYSDTKGRILIKPQYANVSFFNKNLAIVCSLGLYYLIDPKNKKISKPYSMITLRNDFLCREECYEVLDNKKTAYLDVQGQPLAESCCYSAGVNQGWDEEGIPFLRDTVINNLNYKYFVNDTLHTMLKGDIYSVVEEYPGQKRNREFEGFYFIREGELLGLIYHNGKNVKEIFKTEYNAISPFLRSNYDIEKHYMMRKGEIYYIVKKNDKEALIFKDETIIPYKYKAISWQPKNDLLWVKLINGKIGYINFDGIEYFKD